MFRRRRRDEGEPEPTGDRGPAPVPPPYPVDGAGEPLRNTAIVEAMRQVALDDQPETRSMLFQLLLDSTLIAVTPDTPPEPSRHVAKEGETISLVTGQGPDGTILPVFTSPDTVLEWRPEGAGYVALPARALFEMAVGAGTATIHLDPGSATHGIVTRTEIESLARGRLPLGKTEVIAEATTVQIGRPATPPPPDVLDALRAAFGADGRVERAWLYLMAQGDQPAEVVVAVRFVAGIDTDPARAQEAMRAVIDDAGARSEGVRPFLFVHPEHDLEASLAAGGGVEVYRRS